jgi:hypothetical protein
LNTLLVPLLLTFLSFSHENTLKSARCLVFLGNIHEQIWNEFLEIFYGLRYHKSDDNNNNNQDNEEDGPSNHNLRLLFRVIDSLVDEKLVSLSSFDYPKITTEVYLGYDIRDQKDYHTEGYQGIEEEKQKIQELRESNDHLLQLFLTIVLQIFLVRNDILMIQIEENRCEQPSNSHNNRSGVRIEREIVSRLLSLSEKLLSFGRSLADEFVTGMTTKIIIFVSNQFPLLNLKTTEIADNIVLMDNNSSSSFSSSSTAEGVNSSGQGSGAGGGLYAQGVILLLNENGYPNMNSLRETLAAIRFSINVFYSEASELLLYSTEGVQASSATHGNFYVNDIKVLLEVCLRELINIPKESIFAELRLR